MFSKRLIALAIIANFALALAPQYRCIAAALAQSYQIASTQPDTKNLSETINVSAVEAPTAVDKLTRQILLEIIKLERFNLHYKIEAAKQGRWKGLRYAAFNEANSALGLAGGLISIYERGSHLRNPTRVNAHVQESANTIPEIGSIIGAGAAALEFGINEFHEFVAHKKGFSPSKAIRYVTETRNNIDRLIAERDALLKVEMAAPALAATAEIDVAEGTILQDLKNQSLLEFDRFHLSARRLFVFQQTQYLFDFSKNVTNALGAQFAYLSLNKHYRPWNMRAGILYEVSGGLYMAGPIVSRLMGYAASRYHHSKLKPTLRDAESQQVAALERDKTILDQLCARCTTEEGSSLKSTVERVATYSDHSKIFQDEMEASSAQNAKAKLVATQNIGAGLYVGGSKVASGVLFVIPGVIAHGKTKRDSKITNNYLFSAAVVGVPASTFAILDTLRIQIKGELQRHKLAKAGMLPAQLVNARLAQLDVLETKLKSEI